MFSMWEKLLQHTFKIHGVLLPSRQDKWTFSHLWQLCLHHPETFRTEKVNNNMYCSPLAALPVLTEKPRMLLKLLGKN